MRKKRGNTVRAEVYERDTSKTLSLNTTGRKTAMTIFAHNNVSEKIIRCKEAARCYMMVGNPTIMIHRLYSAIKLMQMAEETNIKYIPYD